MKQNKINTSIGLPKHKQLLREALMKNYVSKENLFVNLIKKIKDMTESKRFLAPVGIFGMIIMVALGILVLGKTTNPKLAEAKELINKSSIKIQMMTEEEKEEAEKMFNDNLEMSLDEAKAAKDLEVVIGEELEKIKQSLTPAFNSMPSKDSEPAIKTGSIKISSNQEVATLDNGKSDEKTAEVAVTSLTRIDVNGQSINLKTVFKYTNPQGKKVILGINENDIPILKTVTF